MKDKFRVGLKLPKRHFMTVLHSGLMVGDDLLIMITINSF